MNKTLTFKIGNPSRVQIAVQSHTTFDGTLCLECTFRHVEEKGILLSLDRAYT
ncbi:conserved hypothetical protein [Ricinus communis]|uniref:Uncharacterized protein n=1 Tax=Ricinus communis TaxID=3988 RepID=B9SAA2_RICCO|nr:conserved hypothetical protein [Ricinus communis]